MDYNCYLGDISAAVGVEESLLTNLENAWVLVSIQRGRLRWFGHVKRMDKTRWVKKCMEIVVEGHRGGGGGKS